MGCGCPRSVRSFGPALPAAVMTHRYPLDTTANDVVGGANGDLMGNTFLSNGSAFFDGTNSGVQLPANLFTNYDSISFETWYVDQAASNTGAFLYVFDRSPGALGMSYQLVGEGSCAISTLNPATNAVSIPIPTVGRTNHLVWTQESNSQTARLYVNGVLAGQTTNFGITPALLGATSRNLIGRGAFLDFPNPGLGNFRGSISEFRVFQGALSPLEVAVSDAAGPDLPQVTVGNLQSIRLVLPPASGTGAALQPQVFADYAGLSNVNITGLPELVLFSDNTNVALIGTNQIVLTAGLGTANIVAAYSEFSNAVAISVVSPQDYILAHRYSFSEAVGTGIAYDAVGIANGRVRGYGPTNTPQFSGFSGTGELLLNGSGFVDLPPGLASSQSEITAEAWLTWNGGSPWQQVFSFGGGQSGFQIPGSYLYFTALTGPGSNNPPVGVAEMRFTTNSPVSGIETLDSTGPLGIGVGCHLAVAYSYPRGMATLYINGAHVATGEVSQPLSSLGDTNNLLGWSQFYLDPKFLGRFSEFRIYNGFLQDSDIAADYAAGPDVIGTDFRAALRQFPAPA